MGIFTSQMATAMPAFTNTPPKASYAFPGGKSGTDPGQFNIAHNIATDKDGWVYVADRENHRIQVFDANGKFETQWVNMARPSGLYIDQASETTYIGEIGSAISANAEARQLGSRVSIYNLKGEVLARLGDQPPGEAPGQFISPHGISIDSHGDIYVGEVSWTQYRSAPRSTAGIALAAKTGSQRLNVKTAGTALASEEYLRLDLPTARAPRMDSSTSSSRSYSSRPHPIFVAYTVSLRTS